MSTQKKTDDPTVKSGGNAEKRGDHWADDLEGSYRENPDKPDPSSVAQVQDPPEGWPGT